MAWSKLVDMELDDEASMDAPMPIAGECPRHPFGLRICLTDQELDKLELDHADCEVGDYVDLRGFARVTSKSVDDGPGGKHCRIEMQIEKLAIEDGNHEDE